MGTFNDDISLILTKAKMQGFLPDVKDSEVDFLKVKAKELFGTDSTLYDYSPKVDVQVFDSSSTWVKPAGASIVEVVVVNGGAGGGSGRRGAATTIRCGGGGGAGGGCSIRTLRASDLPSTVTITVGIGGTGGAAVTTNDTNGNSGTNGTQSSFGSYVQTAAQAVAGAGGTATTGNGGAISNNAGGSGPSLAGGTASTTGGNGGSGSGQGAASWGFVNAGPGGGSGGGITAADSASNGGNGGVPAYGAAPNTAAAGIVDSTQPNSNGLVYSPGPGGCGGGGGAASITTNAQNGATGGKYGGGGGGGGASLNGFNSGAGGNGGSGVVVVTTYLTVPSDSGNWYSAGDSLTQGAGGSGTTYPSVFGTSIGKSVLNLGVGGETSSQIASRIGAVPITVAAVTIAATGATTIVTTPSIVSVQGGPITGVLAGIRGTLTYSAGSVLFTRSESVVSSTAIPAGSVFIPDHGAARMYDNAVIWVGRNNYTDPDTVFADAVAISNQIKNGKFIIMSVLNGNYVGLESKGASGYNTIINLNNRLASKFGDHYLDIRSYLISNGLSDAAISPTSQDLIDIANDIVPGSLRSDAIHLNAAGYTVVGNRVAAKKTALGY